MTTDRMERWKAQRKCEECYLEWRERYSAQAIDKMIDEISKYEKRFHTLLSEKKRELEIVKRKTLELQRYWDDAMGDRPLLKNTILPNED